MLRLVKPPKAAANMLRDLGVSVTDGDGKMKSLSQIVGELGHGMEGMTQAQKGCCISYNFRY